MRAALRFILRTIKWLSVLLIGLAIVVPIGLYFFFDPNDFKPQISTFLSEQTGLPLNIEGKMEFSVFPWLGLKIQNISLDQVPDFGNNKFVHMKELDLQIPLHDLLRKQLVIETLMVKGLTLNLVKAANGQTNWEVYAKSLEKAPKSPQSEKTVSPSAATARKSLSFALKEYDIQDAKVTFTDNKEKQTWVANHLSLEGTYSTTRATPIATKFELTLTPFKQNATLLGKGNLKGTINFNKAKRAIDLKTDLSINMPDTFWKNATLTASLTGDLDKQIKIDSIDLLSGSIHATGNAVFPFDTSKAITFSLALNELNLNQFKTPASPPKSTPHSSASTDDTQKTLLISTPQGSKERTFDGSISINKLQYDDYTLSQVNANIRKEGSIITLKPLTATIFNAKLSANITHNLATTGAPTSMQGKLSDLAIQPLLRILKKPEKVSGIANIDFNLANEPSGLHGVIKCNVTQGAIEGIDIMYYLALAQSLLKKQEGTATDSKHTAFSSLTATLLLHDGLIDNNDLTILGEGYKANAEGSINLNNQTLAYKLKAFKVYSDGKEHNAYPLAIRIKGPIQSPKIEPDLDVYMKTLINSHFDTKADKLVKKGLNKILGNDSKNDAASPDEAPASKDLEQKISDEVGKGLQKIFKLLP